MLKKSLETIEKKAATSAFNFVWGFIKSKSTLKIDQIKARTAIEEYTRKYNLRYGSVKPIGKSEPIPLYDIFISVNTVSSNYLSQFIDKNEMEEQFIRSGRKYATKEKKLDGISAANQFQYLSILGAPGAGKTTFLRRLGFDALFDFKLAVSNDFIISLEKYKVPETCINKIREALLGKIFYNYDDIYASCKEIITEELFILQSRDEPKVLKKYIDIYEELLGSSINNSILNNFLSRYVTTVGENVNAFQRNYIHTKFPIIIELRRINFSEKNIIDYIEDELQICGFPNSNEFVNHALGTGFFLILFDGLDEVDPKERKSIVDKIHDFITRFEKNRYIISCRTAAYKHSFESFTDVVLADFDEKQINDFAMNWFNSEADKRKNIGAKFINELHNPKHESIKELAKTPILLTFLCIAYDQRQRFPANRSKLYEKVINIIIEEWAAKKRIHDEPIHEDITNELELDMLSEISINGMMSGTFLFERKVLLKCIKEFLINELKTPKDIDFRSILNNIEVYQGIIIKRADNLYSFSHLTVQEYLAALFICQEHKKDYYVNTYMFDSRWREVFILIAGQEKSDELLELIAEKTFILISASDNIGRYIRCINKKVNGRANVAHERVSKVLIGLYVSLLCNVEPKKVQDVKHILDSIEDIIKSYDWDHKYEKVILEASNLARSRSSIPVRDYSLVKPLVDILVSTSDSLIDFSKIINILEKIKNNFYSNEYKRLKMECNSSILEALGITDNEFTITEDDKKTITNYLYILQLVSECKNASYRLSEKAWEFTINKILLS